MFSFSMILVVYPGRKIFHTVVAVSIFLQNQVLGEVSSSRIEE